MNDENLVPQAHVLSVEEASRGGKASAEARKKKKAAKDAMLDLLETPMNDTWKKYINEDETGVRLNLDAMDDNMQSPFVASLYKAAVLDRNTKAMELLLAIIGEKPADKIQNEVSIVDSPIDSLTSELFEGEDNAKT